MLRQRRDRSIQHAARPVCPQVPSVKAAARLVVSDNDSDGVAEAIERLLL